MKENERALAARLVAVCRRRSVTVDTAESCTGGLVAARITAVPGASAIFPGGVVSYANAAKHALLGVDEAMLARDGAVSATCAQAMARGARTRFNADLAIALTGIAGPDGGTPQKPVGLVYLGLADARGTASESACFEGTRNAVRRQAVVWALTRLLDAASRA